MDTLDKLAILADAAKFDAACTSSGVDRDPQAGKVGMASAAGCCHSFTPDGRCITLLKFCFLMLVVMTVLTASIDPLHKPSGLPLHHRN